MTEDGPTTCEVCGGPLRRILHPAGIIFKGSGFYKTDSRASTSGSVSAGSSKKAPSTDGGGSAPASDSAGKAADKKPATGSGSSSATAGD